MVEFSCQRKTVLVTGATGFVASHLLPVLSQQGWQIVAAVRDRSPQRLGANKTVVVGEIDGRTDWHSALEGVDAVIHLAARAHVLHETIALSEAEFLRVNTNGTANLAKQSGEAGVKQFIFISSIGAMATLSDRLLSEKSPCQPDTPYGRSKLLAERALIEQATNSVMTWTILRPTLVYGPGNPGNMERLIKLIDRGLPLPFGALHNRRSFLFIGNLVDAIAVCLYHPKALNQIFLIGDGQDLSTPQLVQQLARRRQKNCRLLPVPPALLKLLGWTGDKVSRLSQRPFPINTPTIDRLLGSLYVDNSLIQKTLGWTPPYTVEQGLEKTV